MRSFLLIDILWIDTEAIFDLIFFHNPKDLDWIGLLIFYYSKRCEVTYFISRRISRQIPHVKKVQSFEQPCKFCSFIVLREREKLMVKNLTAKRTIFFGLRTAFWKQFFSFNSYWSKLSSQVTSDCTSGSIFDHLMQLLDFYVQC